MKRRDLLLTGGAFASTLALKKLAAQPAGPLTRGAVVIGVDHIQGMPSLHASDDATEIGVWLENEGFNVKLFTDRDGAKVSRSQILNATAELIDNGTLEMLVIYFAGHGYLSGPTRECWMLSGAPQDPGDAVSVIESTTFAKFSGVPNVVFISDACRTLPQTFEAAGVSGNSILPNKTAANPTDVDKFFACLPGWPANEASLDEGLRRQGLFTKSFLSAFQEPRADMILELPGGRRVVPNEKLKKYLKEEVAKRAQNIQLTLKQTPDAEITSEDNIFIGSAATLDSYLPPRETKVPGIEDIVDRSLSEAGASFRVATSALAVSAEVLDTFGMSAGFESHVEEILIKAGQEEFEAETGISVNGATVSAAFGDPNAQIAVHAPNFVAVDLSGGIRGATVGVLFEGGNGGIVAALRGYVANMVVTDNLIKSITYTPTRNSERWSEYDSERERLNQLHATVAAAAGYGGFRIQGDLESRTTEAEKLANDIRVLKSIDPTLGIYAAYAYFDAGLPDQVKSVAEYMRNDLGIQIFDVAMLAGGTGREQLPLNPPNVVPICPMLSQGWDLVRPLRVTTSIRRVGGEERSYDFEGFRSHLRGGLWTTLSSKSLKELESNLTSN